jgi:malonate-semialdehyde dehydrogenase (acetylating)/methylmalonate-semialdehyde dehydrogenase
VSSAITVGDASKKFKDAIVGLATELRVGNGLQDGVQMGPVISSASKSRIEQLIGKGLQQGGQAILDGRSPKIDGGDRGSFLKPTILTGITPENELSGTEIFGPVLALQEAGSLEEAIQILSQSRYGNAASIFTSDGNAARKFRYEVQAGNIGVNIGVAAPMAYFPFSGWKDSFLGVLHGQGRDGVEFYTDKKVVVERWPKEWTRKF